MSLSPLFMTFFPPMMNMDMSCPQESFYALNDVFEIK
jgi:hypothetical protein